MSKTEIVAIIDQSGSMSKLKEDVIGGFNEFLDEQKGVEGEADITLTLFDTNVNMVYSGTPLGEAENLNEDTYRPAGGTALLDAVGETVDKVGERLAETNEEDRPDQVLVMIITDGYENSSVKYTADEIKEKVKHQEGKYSWEFMYQGANVDSFTEAQKMGIKASSTVDYAATGQGMGQSMKRYGKAATSYRRKRSIPKDWKEVDNEEEGE